jgi:hypothetical protein
MSGDDLPALVAADKELAGEPAWRPGRGPDDLEMSVPLEIEGIVIEGLTLRGRVLKSLPDREVAFQLEYHGPRIIGGPICRIDWKPLGTHSNRGVGPKDLRHVLQKWSHHHRFDLNWARSEEGVLRGEIPIAVPLETDPKNFRDLLGVVGKEFKIARIQVIGIPPWEPAML